MNLYKRLIFLMFAIVFVIPFDINAQISGIPPAMLDQFKNMTPAEQRRIAQQYGIDIRSLGQLTEGSEGLSELGSTKQMRLYLKMINDYCKDLLEKSNSMRGNESIRKRRKFQFLSENMMML